MAIMSAFTLQQQLGVARDTAQSLSEQMTALRQFYAAGGDSGKAGVAAIDRIAGQLIQSQGQIDRAMTAASGLQNAMDGYDGLPTASQIRQLEWAKEDATAAIEALNRLIVIDLPAAGGSIKLPEMKPVPTPVR